jgi:DNA polymerase-3 subunit delta'
MKSSNKKEIIAVNIAPSPKSNANLAGHAKQVAALVDILNSGKMPQSWLFSGPKGIGKATLAYRFARAILAHAGNKINELYVSPDSPVFSKIVAGSHSDLLVIEPAGDSASGEIKVDDIRKINDFVRLTASETKYRIVIIDSADDMNTNAANALLKLLEEPPYNVIFLLVSHTPGRLLPTIKSRCRNLRMSALEAHDVADILKHTLPDLSPSEAAQLITLAGGSVGIAVDLYYNDGIKIYNAIMQIFSTLPKISSVNVQNLSSIVTKKEDSAAWKTMCFLLDSLLIRVIKGPGSANEQQVAAKLFAKMPQENLLQIWEKLGALIADTDRINLDKKAVIVSIFEEF